MRLSVLLLDCNYILISILMLILTLTLSLSLHPQHDFVFYHVPSVL